MNTPIRLAGAVAAVAVIAVLGTLLVSMFGNTGAPVGTPPSTAIPSVSNPTTSAATAVAAGYDFTCAITSGGGVKCWGANGVGQLGNDKLVNSSTPVDVAGLTSGVTAITLSPFQSCVLTSQAGVKCWGGNDDGQLGNGAFADSSTPVDVSGLTSGATAIAGGSDWFCALTSGGGVKCWGWNNAGQLGNGQTVNQSIPVDVAGLGGGVTAIAAGGRHSCALTNTGGVKCWGDNAQGALGDGSSTNTLTPVDVVGLTSGVTAIAAGDLYTCALLEDGAVRCWGRNHHGQLGNGTTTDSMIPVEVSGLASGVAAIAATRGVFDDYHTCALMTVGGVKCWGLNADGQLGNGTTTDSSIPVDVSGLADGVTAITTGSGGNSCALTDSGGVKCWGDNSSGQLGDGTTADSSIPVDVKGL